MAKRVVLISSLPVCIVLAALAIIFVGIGQGHTAKDIEQAKENIYSLINAGKLAEAALATDKLAADLSGNPVLPEVLYSIAEKYEQESRFEQANILYEQIVEDFPDSPYASKAELGFWRAETMSLIMSRDYNQAGETLDTLSADFADHPDLPGTLFWISERYERMSKFEQAKRIWRKVSQYYPNDSYATKALLYTSRAEVMSLIMSQKFDQAQEVIEKMFADFNGHPDLPEALFWATERFIRLEKFEEAKHNYERIIEDFPSSPWADKARFFIARVEATALIVSKDYEEAQKAIDRFAADFAGNTDLPEALYWISGRFQAFDRFEDAKQICEQIISDYPDSPWAKKAKMGSAMSEAMSLVVSGKFAEAKAVTDKMAADFAGNPDLPEVLFWITDRYERVQRFDDANHNYQQIVQNFPDSPWADKAKLVAVKETVISLIHSKDYENAKTALSNMIIDFNDYKELPEALYWINESYELSGKFDEAEQIFKTIQKYPNDLFAQRATLGLRRVEVMRLLAKDSSEAENTLNKMIEDFKADDELPHSVFLIGQKCINDANVPNYLQRALNIFEKVINDLPRTSTIAGLQGDLYFYAGRCCDETELYPKALTYFQKIVDSYPDFTLSWYAQFKLGSIPQKMKEKGTLNPQEADKATKDAYKQLLIKYPDCPNASTAKTWLSENVKEG